MMSRFSSWITASKWHIFAFPFNYEESFRYLSARLAAHASWWKRCDAGMFLIIYRQWFDTLTFNTLAVNDVTAERKCIHMSGQCFNQLPKSIHIQSKVWFLLDIVRDMLQFCPHIAAWNVLKICFHKLQSCFVDNITVLYVINRLCTSVLMDLQHSASTWYDTDDISA